MSPRSATLRRPAAVTLALALLASLAVLLPTSPARAAGGPELVTLRSTDGGFSYQPWLVDSGGSFVRRLTTQDAITQPAVSPDGRTVVFSGPQNDSDSLGRYGLFTVRTDGTGLRAITAPRFGDLDPAFSADGTRVVYTRSTDGSLTTSCCTLWEAAANGAGSREIAGTRNGRQGTYTPDGTTVVFVGTGGLRSVPRTGGTSQLVAAGLYADPAVSPDGRTVAVTLVRSPARSDLALVDLTSGSVRTLLTSSGRVEDPQWSPDGRTVFLVEHAGQGYLGRSGSVVRAAPVAGGAAPVVADPPGEIVELATAGTAAPVFGNIDLLRQAPGEIRARGWAIDPDTADPVDVEVVVDGAVASRAPASDPRPDVANVYPAYGANHGFDRTVALTAGPHTVCVRARDKVAPGPDPVVLGCRTLTGTPVGLIDRVQNVPGGVRLTGWTLDPDVADPIRVHVYVDDAGSAFTADGDRPDVGRSFPGYGDAHGFDVTVPVPVGRSRVCAYGIGVGAGGNATLGCREVTRSGTPVGVLDGVTDAPGGVRLTGWTLDPDVADPIRVHVYVDDAGSAFTADGDRPDVGRAFPGYGDAHGFDVTVPVPVGRHRVCAYGIGVGAGGNVSLGCREVTRSGTPVGVLDSVEKVPGGVRLTGWTLDPDVADPIRVHVYVDGAGSAFTADGDRPDVGRAFPGYGDAHGFDVTVPLPAGPSRVCAYGIGVGAGGNVTLGCRQVTG